MFKACIIIAATASFCLVSSLELKFDGPWTAFSAPGQGKGEETSSLETLNNKVNVRAETIFMMRIMKEYSPYQKDIQVKSTGCQCADTECSCCLQISIAFLKIDDEVCVKIAFIPNDLALEIELLWDGNVILDEKISAKNPPPICVGIPYFTKLAGVCIKFYDLEVQDNSFHGCLAIEVKIFGRDIETWDLGCINIPPNQIKSVNKTLIKGPQIL